MTHQGGSMLDKTHQLYSSLKTKKWSESEWNELSRSIRRCFRVHVETARGYHPLFPKLMSLRDRRQYLHRHYHFDTSSYLVKVDKICKKLTPMCFIGRVTLGSNRRRISQGKKRVATKLASRRHSTCFLKIVPLIEFQHAPAYYRSRVDDFQTTLCNPVASTLVRDMYDHRHSVNMEMYVSYLINQLSLLDLSPHFLEFYGSVRAIFPQVTFSVDEDELDRDTVAEFASLGLDISDLTRQHCRNNGVEKSNGDDDDDGESTEDEDEEDVEVTIPNIPAVLAVFERSDTTLGSLLGSKEFRSINPNTAVSIMTSIMFQAFSAVCSYSNTFGIRHNDLHVGNVMITHVPKYLTIKYADRFLVPTYGYLVKIIDWGRASYSYEYTRADKSTGSFGAFSTYNDGDSGGRSQWPQCLPHNRGLGDGEVLTHAERPLSDIFMLASNVISYLHNLAHECEDVDMNVSADNKELPCHHLLFTPMSTNASLLNCMLVLLVNCDGKRMINHQNHSWSTYIETVRHECPYADSFEDVLTLPCFDRFQMELASSASSNAADEHGVYSYPLPLVPVWEYRTDTSGVYL
jgi:hypothetical protein